MAGHPTPRTLVRPNSTPDSPERRATTKKRYEHNKQRKTYSGFIY